ncbi:unnamed protein product, partial [Polarella glacialis]
VQRTFHEYSELITQKGQEARAKSERQREDLKRRVFEKAALAQKRRQGLLR